MNVLASIDNIKIPYPVEGIIRTAQLDDTVSPEDSAQLAVNMNFDRVGAIQTRLGVTEYATTLSESISNYGVLRNAIRPDGYDSLLILGETSTWSASEVRESTLARVDDTHVIVFWSGVANDGFTQVMETSLVTGGLVPIGTALEFDAVNGTSNKCIRIDGTHFLNVWTGANSDAFAQVFLVNSTTFAVTAIGTPLEFDTTNGVAFSIAQVDANHFIVFYDNGDSGLGLATILAVNLGTYAVTEPGSTLTFSSGEALSNSCVAIGNGTHFINFWHNVATLDGYAQVFSVNTTTWAITAIGTPLVFDSTSIDYLSTLSLGDGEHFVNSWYTATGGISQVFNVNPSTYAVTTAGSQLIFQASSASEIVSLGLDSTHFFTIWANSSIEYSQLFEVNATTFAITAIGSPLSLGATSSSVHTSAITMNAYRVVALWRNDTPSGLGAMFKMEGDILFSRYLYAGHTTKVSNWNGSSWTQRRSGLAQVSKPRFSQFLNYIWMVNGNESIGGDPVATSSGGAFGTDLVPADFPPGDFISAGFEGRVWVADNYTGAIYYTDIVQFVPPDVYTLTYDAEVNFITTISPQTGETFTALYEVPRALLVFTENTITRIYGASSLDAYPAYNVGTFSQESIVETKTGIFFHHSSGFYQFDYGSQPVEISRRIIDFVKAIPRSSYDNIVGVYDGFDCIEWSVGQVTVEGVVFSSCVLRYTISTQVWTVYDYVGNVITAMIFYDDGTSLNYLMGTSTGLTGAMGTGLTDFTQPFYFEYIDRWRGFTDMYYQIKSASGFNVYSENAAGVNLMYQIQKSGANAWKQLGTVTEANNSVLPNSATEDFDVMRLRLAGNTKGAQIVIHGIEIPTLIIKGQDTN